MKERPILFSGDMVRAILEGRKTQTRRPVKPQPEMIQECEPEGYSWVPHYKGKSLSRWSCPYGKPGDRLWVRETWGMSGKDRVEYKASPADGKDFRCVNHWRPSIHMPRWASRILLEIVSVRVERVQEISDQDAQGEGIVFIDHGKDRYDQQLPGWAIKEKAIKGYEYCHNSPRFGFANLWEKINAAQGFGWDANPWVWVIGFKVVEVKA